MNFGRIVTAMVTPFDEQGEIDFQATQNLINYLISNGTEALVVSGTTGESPTLTNKEKAKLFKFTVNVVNGRVPVIAGTGTNNTKESMEMTLLAENAGVDGIMLVTPYYNKPCQEGLYQHFKAIAEITTLPIMLYNIPGRSVVNMSVETVIRLSKIRNIVAIKEASGDLDTMAEIIDRTPKSFALYSGDDGLTLPVLSIGGAGVVSVASHVVGNDMQTMIAHFQRGDFDQAAREHRRLLPIMRALFAAPNPSAVKAALNLKGIPVGGVRLPMIPLNSDQLRSLYQSLTLYEELAFSRN
ncbi:4-hydroxy-tetrahydrodipicolinate synthase [Sporosarcina sp. NCCP-2222]|uniref:4-hydroxy-tetrahydrodipicolinate synthase n=1 Tax=Sporosarcina sp. NCCP-2222 TaxID=2935073 RepID=UPI00208698BB|nr:4-hydroxy-tetrahydrodipicolinate synthase [Sporosarcina sp. NCCP-2222]GKV56463.1 4-hydroxy-tetrahydrodipicolinate synthase [Sporosarcina sp. NCCP-2222]